MEIKQLESNTEQKRQQQEDGSVMTVTADYTTEELQKIYDNLDEGNRIALENENQEILKMQGKEIDYFIEQFRKDKWVADSKYHELYRRFLFGGILAFQYPSEKSIRFIHRCALELVNELASKTHKWLSAKCKNPRWNREKNNLCFYGIMKI